MKDLKLYWLWVNNGDWGGSHDFFVIASNKEEAMNKSKVFQNYIEMGYYYSVREMNGEDILQHLNVREDSYVRSYEKYNFEYKITPKDDK